MRTVLGAVMIVMALVVAIAPVFSDCESQGKMLTTADGRSVSMKCHWSGIAEVGAAVPLGIAGIFAQRGRRKETLRFAGIIGVAAGAAAILFPTVLIGVCGNPTMICNLLMRPVLLAAGTLAMVAGVGVFVFAREPELVAVEVAE